MAPKVRFESDIIGIIERKHFELHVESPKHTMKIALICSKLIRNEWSD